MSEVKRWSFPFHPEAGPEELSPTGDYVLHSDYEKLISICVREVGVWRELAASHLRDKMQIEAHLAVAVEALRFYADSENWEEFPGTDTRTITSPEDSYMAFDDIYPDPFTCGGKIAHDALAKIKGAP